MSNNISGPPDLILCLRAPLWMLFLFKVLLPFFAGTVAWVFLQILGPAENKGLGAEGAVVFSNLGAADSPLICKWLLMRFST